MQILTNIWSFLIGKKTYIVAGVAVAYALTQLWTGAITPEQAVELITIALGLGSIRHGVTTTLRKE